MVLPEGFELQRASRRGALVRRDVAKVPFDEWWQRGTPLQGAAGRGAVVRARIAGVDVAIRTYRRGGALRRLLPDRFRGPERAFAEVEALECLRARGVPAVAPVAAVARRVGLLWELRLATELVPDAVTLPAFVAGRPELRRAAVHAAGAAVGAAFAAGMDHRDLHPENLIARAVGGGCEVVILDLDRATVSGEPTPAAARDAMLVRMARYLRKHRGRLPSRETRTDVLRFLRATGLDRAARRKAVRRLGTALERQLRKRGWSSNATPVV